MLKHLMLLLDIFSVYRILILNNFYFNAFALDAKAQGFDPDYTIADGAAGLRAGQQVALGDTPCHGDEFHIQHPCETLANLLGRLTKGAATRRQGCD